MSAMNNPSGKEDRRRPGTPMSTGGSATPSSAGGAPATAAATGPSDLLGGDFQPGRAGSTAAAAAATSSPAGNRRSSRIPSRGTVSYQEDVQAPNPSPHRGSHEDRWNDHFGALKKYKKENGNCNVPRKYPSNPALASFVHYVRNRQGDLSEERRKMLEELGFVFNAHEAAWEEKFSGVKEFFGEAGCSGSSMSALRSENKSLYDWIRKQRAAYARLRRGDLSAMAEDKISRLEEIGIDLDPSGKFSGVGGGGGSRRKSKKEKKARGATSSGSSSSAHGKSPNFRSHNRARVSPGRRQKANQQGGIPAAAREAARKPQKQVARKRTGKGIEIGRFEQPQQRMSYASDQPSQYQSSQAQGATARKQDHATTASPTNQSGPGVPKDASYADTDAHLESSFGDVGIEMDPTRKSLKPPYDGSGDDNKHRRKSNMDFMGDSSHHSPPADGEDRNYCTYGGPFSRQATSQQKEAATLKAPYLSDQSYQHYASVGPAAHQKAAADTGVSSRHASYCDAAKDSTSHGHAPIAHHQGRSAASFSSVGAKLDTRGPATDSSQGQQRHSMEAMRKDAGKSSSGERRRRVQEADGRGGTNAASGVGTIHQHHDLLRLLHDYDEEVAIACMAGASDPTDYRPIFLRADLDLNSIADPQGQVQTQRIRPTSKETAPANKKAKSSSGSGFHQGRRGTVANQGKTIDPVLASVDDTGTSHANGVPQDRRAADKGVWKNDSDQARTMTNSHNDSQGLAACSFQRVSATATTRAAKASGAISQMGMDIIANRPGQGHRQQSQQKVRYAEKESSHSSGAVDGHHNCAYPSDQGQYKQEERAASDEAIDDGPCPSFQKQSPFQKHAKARNDNLAIASSQGQGQLHSLEHEEAAPKKASRSNGAVANRQSYDSGNQLGVVPDSVAGAHADNASGSVAVSPTGAPKADNHDNNDECCSERTDAAVIGDPQEDFELQFQEEVPPYNGFILNAILTCWYSSPDPMCPIEPERSEVDQKARALSEATGVEEAVRRGKAFELITYESLNRIDLLGKYKYMELTSPLNLEQFVGWHPVKETDVIDPIFKHRMRVLLKAMEFDVGDLPRPKHVLEEELKEGKLLLERVNFLYNNPEELEKCIVRGSPTNEDVGIAPEIREMFRYVESIAGTETYEIFCKATGEKQREMIAEYNRKNPHNPAGLISLDYTGPPGKRKFVDNPKKKDDFVCPLIKKRMELMIEGLDRQRKRLFRFEIFEKFDQNRVRLLELEKERFKDIPLEVRELYVTNASKLRAAMWSTDVDINGKKLTEEQELDKAAYIFWWFYHHECLLDQCVSRVHWVPNKHEVWIRPDLLEKAARAHEYHFGENRIGFHMWKAWEEDFPVGMDLQPLQDATSKARREYLKCLENAEKDWFKLFNHLADTRDTENFEEAAKHWETLTKTWMEDWKQVFVDLLHYFNEQEQQESQDGRSP